MSFHDYASRWPDDRLPRSHSLPSFLSSTTTRSTAPSTSQPSASTNITAPSTAVTVRGETTLESAESGGSSQATGAQTSASKPILKPDPRPVQYLHLTPEQLRDVYTLCAGDWADQTLAARPHEDRPIPFRRPPAAAAQEDLEAQRPLERLVIPPRRPAQQDLEAQRPRATTATTATAAAAALAAPPPPTVPPRSHWALILLVGLSSIFFGAGVYTYMWAPKAGYFILIGTAIATLAAIPIVAMVEAGRAPTIERVILVAMTVVMGLGAWGYTLVTEKPVASTLVLISAVVAIVGVYGAIVLK